MASSHGDVSEGLSDGVSYISRKGQRFEHVRRQFWLYGATGTACVALRGLSTQFLEIWRCRKKRFNRLNLCEERSGEARRSVKRNQCAPQIFKVATHKEELRRRNSSVAESSCFMSHVSDTRRGKTHVRRTWEGARRVFWTPNAADRVAPECMRCSIFSINPLSACHPLFAQRLGQQQRSRGGEGGGKRRSAPCIYIEGASLEHHTHSDLRPEHT